VTKITTFGGPTGSAPPAPGQGSTFRQAMESKTQVNPTDWSGSGMSSRLSNERWVPSSPGAHLSREQPSNRTAGGVV